MACAVTAGPLNPAALAARVAAAAPILRDEALQARLARGDTKEIPVDRLKQIGVAVSGALSVLPAAAHLLSQQYAAEAAPALSQPLIFFEASPRLAIATIGRADGRNATSEATVSLDLRRNPLRVVGRGVAAPTVIAANIARGVLDGAIEDALISGDGAAVSTASVLAEARVKGIVMAASVPSAAQAAGWPDDARARIRADQSPNTAVVAPERAVAVAAAQRAAWWRVDTTTGETVGVIDSGLNGAAGPDYAAALGFVMGMVWAAQLFLSGVVAVLVMDCAVAFILAAGPGAVGAGKKGWEAAKKRL
jgi:hypothetical protein